jgi:putative FmdB family regulatory protein
MPVYEYFCRKCKKSFTAEMHVAEHERDLPPCPECGSKDGVEKQMSAFSAVTSHKSATF